MDGAGIKDKKKPFKPPPPKPHTVIALTPEEVKQHIKEASKLARAGVKEKEGQKKKKEADQAEEDLLDGMANQKTPVKKPPMKPV